LTLDTDLVFDIEPNAMNLLFDGVFNENSGRIGINTATYDDCTCCVIKPHIISAGMLGAVLYEIQKAGFEVSAIQSVTSFFRPHCQIKHASWRLFSDFQV
jgi:hypothetical protein